ncbi:Maspardin [Balamuthia mandrillaris]
MRRKFMPRAEEVEDAAYKNFRSWVALNRVVVEHSEGEAVWKYYDYGPRECPPLICLCGTSGTAESFYKQIVGLSSRGYRVISVQAPPYMSHYSWVKGFDRFLVRIGLNNTKVHLFGTTLGGFQALYFAQCRPQRVASIILCNAIINLNHFAAKAPCLGMFGLAPEFLLKRMLLSNFPRGKMEASIAQSVDFMVAQVDDFSHADLVSRLTLTCSPTNFAPYDLPIPQSAITIITSLDPVSVPYSLLQQVIDTYPKAKIAYLKTGGNFPFLCRADEVNMYIQVHMRKQGIGVVPSEHTTTEEMDEEHKHNANDKESKEEEEEIEEDTKRANEEEVNGNKTKGKEKVDH